MIDDTERLMEKAENTALAVKAAEIELKRLRDLRADTIIALRAYDVPWQQIASIVGGKDVKYLITLTKRRQMEIDLGAKHTSYYTLLAESKADESLADFRASLDKEEMARLALEEYKAALEAEFAASGETANLDLADE